MGAGIVRPALLLKQFYNLLGLKIDLFVNSLCVTCLQFSGIDRRCETLSGIMNAYKYASEVSAMILILCSSHLI